MSSAAKWTIVASIAVIAIVMLAVTQLGCLIFRDGETDVTVVAVTVEVGMANATYHIVNEIDHAKTKADVILVLTTISDAGIDIFDNDVPPVDENDAKAQLIDVAVSQMRTLQVVTTLDDEKYLRSILHCLSLKEIVFWMLDTMVVIYPDLAQWRYAAKDVLKILDAWLGPEIEYGENTRILLLAFFTGIHDGCNRVGE